METNLMKEKSIISQILSTNIPDVLYHYTNSTGLKGIITSKQIWVTKVHYMNDKSELQLAFDYIRDEINQQRKGVRTKQDDELDKKYNVLDDIELVNITIASFTEEGDQLSQWRGYCEIGDGYSLGFSGRNLLKQAKAEGYQLVPCVYEEKIHRDIVKELVNTTSSKEFRDKVIFNAPIIKSGSFKEEKEWRLISNPLDYKVSNFRQGTNSLIPYWKFDINLAETLRSIIIGPTAEPDLSKGAISGLIYKELELAGIDVISQIINNIRYSKIPYRIV